MVKNNNFNQTQMKTQTTDLTIYKNKLSVIEANASALIIKTEEQIKSASDILFQIKTFRNKIDEEKQKFVEPAKVIIVEARKKYDPYLKQLDSVEVLIKDKMIKFASQEEKKMLKKLEDFSAKVVSGKLDLANASEKISGLEAKKSYSGDVGGVQVRENKTIVITNVEKIPRKFMGPNLVMIRKAVLGGEIIPGVEIKIEKVIASRGN